MSTRHLLVLAVAAFTSGCLFASGGGPSNTNGTDNNGTANNGTANNGTANNGTSSGSNNATVGKNNTTVSPNNVTSSPGLCGNGKVDLGETCDPCGPIECPSRGCALFAQVGSVETCDLTCVENGTRTACTDGDGCCPDGCGPDDDSDCSADCGNGVLDPDETCDPCESCPGSTVCAPINVRGDASTCDLICSPGEPHEDCCGLDLCAADEVCLDDMCQEIPPEKCSDAPDPQAYCDAIMPGTECVGDQCVPIQPMGCATNDDCLPWERCMSNTCIEPDNCYAAMPNSQEWCAHSTFANRTWAPCAPDINNGGYSCSGPIANLPCADASVCQAWEGCVSGSCRIPDGCGAARDPDLWCVFETERLGSTCAGNTCS